MYLSHQRYKHDEAVQKEQLRQARWAFNVGIGLTVTSSLISIIGIILLFTGNISEGTFTATGGFAANVVSVRYLQLAKDANKRLIQMITERRP